MPEEIQPRSGIAGHRVEDLIADLRELVETARMMPMSSSVLVHRDEALTLLEDLVAALPQELREARWLLKERDEYLVQAQREADAIIEAGRVQAERLVQRTEIAREARRTAEQLVADAEAEARRMRHEAEDYVDARLAAFEETLAKVMGTVRKGRERLQVPMTPITGEVVDEMGHELYDQDT